jgi:DMSO/TMAO reductase YedYZ molybdopterin-dependent catalytic subunit
LQNQDPNLIRSPDTLRQDRLPPGQTLTETFPVLHHGSVPKFHPDKWEFKIFGLVEPSRTLTYSQFTDFPVVQVFSDIHCVTHWSKLNNYWSGYSIAVIKQLVNILPQARFVIVHAAAGFTTNLPIDDFFQPDVLLATQFMHQPLSEEHGGPMRLVVPRLYFWKSAKWVTGLEFTSEDKPGFWEAVGYHNHGDPWKEERYGR